MCRILAYRIKQGEDVVNILAEFAEHCRNSKEYQGDGWGISYFKDYRWHIHKQIEPIWEADFSPFQGSHVFLVHARSASFGDVNIEANMPFETDRFSFAFNGEMRGVRINAPGRTGAEKLFRFIINFYRGDIEDAINKALAVLPRRVEYVRAMNFVILDKAEGLFYTYSQFSEEPEYFTMKMGVSKRAVCISSVEVKDTVEAIPVGQLEVI